ncbi:hypothetical protein BKE38_23755 [Pseudoroseomonas deserti]|uniref:Uncharacterized protein n=1 Tax=Teichococcus deserti TaxID=1817963 RepID=A0A1V2GVX8_9PROT|nr:hypothetical protein [Pseudoroseomonas deserti]ONG47343.1 hypothetical protein BKE38_23755 [Pseudoroseomonas deserti]
MKYDIISGWYCDTEPKSYRVFGDDYVRSVGCFYLWEWCVRTFTSPDQIYILESGSPLLPSLPQGTNINWVKLSQNFGHAVGCQHHHSGWSRALLSGLMYAYCNGSDHAVLVEQGSLFYGQNIIEQQIARYPDAGIIAPSGKGTPQPLQTGILIFRTAIVPDFIQRYTSLAEPDATLSPEKKVARVGAELGLTISDLRFGRSRPLDFSHEHFFLRHATREQLEAFVSHLGLAEVPEAPLLQR